MRKAIWASIAALAVCALGSHGWAQSGGAALSPAMPAATSNAPKLVLTGGPNLARAQAQPPKLPRAAATADMSNRGFGFYRLHHDQIAFPRIPIGQKAASRSAPAATGPRRVQASKASPRRAASRAALSMSVSYSSCAGGSVQPAPIAALAASLKCDPDLIYEYVYNNIQYEPLYGSNKGALGALLDRRGDDADQSMLLTALWSAAGVASSDMAYVNVWLTYTGAQVVQQFGVPNDADAIVDLLDGGGIIHDTPTVVDGQIQSIDIVQFGVERQISGQWYYFIVPGNQSTIPSAVSNLGAAMGYDRVAFLETAGGTYDGTSIANINRSALRQALTTYSSNLQNYIDSQNRSWRVSDVIGGNVMVPLSGSPIRRPDGGFTRMSSFPMYCPNQTPTTVECRTYLTITMPGASSSQAIKLYADEVYGHRITISSVPSGSNYIPTLLIDGAPPSCVGLGTCTNVGPATPFGTSWSLPTTIVEPNQPAANSTCPTVTDCTTLMVNAGGTYLVSTGFGSVGRGMAEYHRQMLDQALATGNSPSSELVLGEGLAVISLNWLAQISSEQNITGILNQSTYQRMFSVGIAGQARIQSTGGMGPYVDMPINLELTAQNYSTGPTVTVAGITYPTAFFGSVLTGIHFSSGAEAGVLLQTQAPVADMTAASTMVLVDNNMNPSYPAAGQKTYLADGSTCAGQSTFMSTIVPAVMSQYGTTDLDNIAAEVLLGISNCPSFPPDGALVLMPQNGLLPVGTWTGAGYEEIIAKSSFLQFWALITGDISGGASGTDVPDPAQNANDTLPVPANSSNVPVLVNTTASPSAPQIAEPVDGVSGAYTYVHSDLITGGGNFPYALSLARHYSSANGTYLTSTSADVGLGNGWSTNFSWSAQVQSDPYIGLGNATTPAVYSTNALAALYVLHDLASITPTAQTLTVSSMAARWLMDQLTGNVVMVTQPDTVEEFVALPHSDGVSSYGFAPPPASSVQLSQIGVGQFQYQRKDGVVLNFGPTPSGALQGWAFPNGMQVNLTYSGSQLTGVSNNLGRSLTLAYAGSHISSVTDDTGRSASYSYDANNNMVGFTDPLGATTTFAYDASGAYDSLAHLTQVYYPANPEIAFVTNWYDPLSRVYQQANANGDQSQFYFAGQRTETVDAAGDDHVTYQTDRGKVTMDAAVLDFASLAQGEVYGDTTQQNGVVNVTTNQYDGLDRLTLSTLPEGGTTSFTYEATLNPWANNIAAIVQTPKPGSGLSALTTAISYDPIYNKPIQIVDPRGLVSLMAYDPSTGNLIRSVSNAGGGQFNAVRTFTYNGFGQVLTATDPLGVITATVYDSRGNPVSITADSGGLNIVSGFAYSALGDVVSATDPKGNTTASAYDADRRRISVTLPPTGSGPGPLATAYGYDANGQLLSTQQSSGGVVLRSTSSTYTLTGKIATSTDANGHVTHFAYDSVDRLTSATDPIGNVTSYGYDALGRKTTTSNLAIQSNPLVQQAYTPDGLAASLTIARSNAVADTTNYAYDGLDRLQTTTYPDSSTEVLTYDADANVLTRKTRKGDTLTFTYDTLNRLSTKAATGMPTVTYGYDLLGRLASANDNSAAITAPSAGASFGLTATYDTLNRPVSFSWTPAATQTTPAATSVAFTHAYDADNRRVSQAANDNSWLAYPSGAGSTSYTANNLNQYTAVGAVTPAYDGNGALTYDGQFTYGYDVESRLTSVVNGATTVGAYAYDAQGRRKTKTVGSAVTAYVTDADNREVLEYDGSTGALKTWYAFGLGPDEVLNQMDLVGGTRATLIPDIQGSIVGALSSSGTLTKVGYQPFGESTTAASNGYFYTGRRLDPETAGSTAQPSGLYYYRARTYSPTWGRFLQADPVSYTAGPNLYTYAGNDPLDQIDPSGTAIVRIQYNAIPITLGLASHSYIIVSDNDGSNATVFRAGPSGSGPVAMLGISTSSASLNPGTDPGFGIILAKSAPYGPGAPDYNPSPRASITEIQDDLPASYYTDKLSSYVDAVNNADIPYSALTTNSNAFAAGALEAIGVARPQAPTLAPGSQTALPVGGGGTPTSASQIPASSEVDSTNQGVANAK